MAGSSPLIDFRDGLLLSDGMAGSPPLIDFRDGLLLSEGMAGFSPLGTLFRINTTISR
jgi:hypothetical protein